MIGKPSREAGLKRLEGFVPSAGARYAKLRNFDFGPDRRHNVSLLSPYIRHRLILEQEVLSAALARHTLAESRKFVQEVFWRSYSKGWLEQRPSVWRDYRSAVGRLLRGMEEDADLRERYLTAVGGNTGIDCFDSWVAELEQTGYLHNHARMWFASIWVYTLELPWQLGADFFYRHLADGDPASNTLGWRWVCGLHTPGKTYLARVSNIHNYTDGRFNPAGQLATSAPPLEEDAEHRPLPRLPLTQSLQPGKRFALLVTEEDCHAESLLAGQTPAAILGAVATRQRSPLPVGTVAYEFAHGAVSDAVERATKATGARGDVAELDNWGRTLSDWAAEHSVDHIATAYAPVGPVAERLSDAQEELERNGITLLALRRPYDACVWPHTRRGYFKLNEQIPALLHRLGVPHSDEPVPPTESDDDAKVAAAARG